MGIKVRRWVRDDLVKAAVLEQACFTDPWNYDMLVQSFFEPSTYGWTAEEDGVFRGMLIYQQVADEYHIATLAVHPESRRRGIATALLSRMTACAAAEGVKGITLEVRAGNAPAAALYEKHGFKTEAMRKKYYKDGEDALIMWRRDGQSG